MRIFSTHRHRHGASVRTLVACAWIVLAGTATAAAAAAPSLEQVRQQAAEGRVQEALQLTEQALQAQPRHAEWRFLRGVLLLDLGRQEAAYAAFMALHESHPELPDPLNNLAVIHAARGEWHDARRRLEEALRNDPSHRSARENLGDVYLRLAVDHWQQATAGGRAEPTLARKLSLGRQLMQQPAPAR